MRPTCRRYRLLLAEIHHRAGDSPAEERVRADAMGKPDDFDLYAPALVLPEAEAHLMEVLKPNDAWIANSSSASL